MAVARRSLYIGTSVTVASRAAVAVANLISESVGDSRPSRHGMYSTEPSALTVTVP